MTVYHTNVVDTDRFGGPFSKLWEVQQWLNEGGYDLDEWDFTSRTKDKMRGDPEEIRHRLDANEYDVPCGERAFSEAETDVYAHYDETSGLFEVDVVATCTECGFKHSDQGYVTPTPK